MSERLIYSVGVHNMNKIVDEFGGNHRGMARFVSDTMFFNTRGMSINSLWW